MWNEENLNIKVLPDPPSEDSNFLQAQYTEPCVRHSLQRSPEWK